MHSRCVNQDCVEVHSNRMKDKKPKLEHGNGIEGTREGGQILEQAAQNGCLSLEDLNRANFFREF